MSPQPSWVSAGTALLDFSLPLHAGKTRTLYGGNYIVAKVNGVKQVLTDAELQKYLDAGYDVECLGYSRS